MSEGETLYQPGYMPLKYCGATRDGVVRFTAEGVSLLSNGGRLSAADAKALGREITAASGVAEQFIEKARGDHLWGSVGREGDVLIVKHMRATARVRPIRNGRAWGCTACGRPVPFGEAMYVCESTPPFRWGKPRLCTACVAPLDPIDRIEAMVSFEVTR